MNLQPWTTGDLAGQEQEGYKDGQLHCKQGWAVDGSGNDTPWLRGYRRGWDEAFRAGLHGTEKIERKKGLQPWDNSYLGML